MHLYGAHLDYYAPKWTNKEGVNNSLRLFFINISILATNNEWHG